MQHAIAESRSEGGHGPSGVDGAEQAGTVLCGWTLLEPLESGAVCSSWLAERTGQRAVARILREPFASRPDARTEWLRSSWSANRFEHARVSKVLEEGATPSGAPVIFRRWIKGDDLGTLVGRGRLDAKLALRIAEQLLDALEMAHAHGIVHGAITPSNVILTPRGNVRLVDFATLPGIVDRPDGPAPVLPVAHSSAFVAPERRQDAAVTREASDIWAVGACMHFALSQSAPIENHPSLRRVVPEADVGLASVVDLALSYDPAERYESAYAMLGDVRRLMAGSKPKLESALAPVPSQGMPLLDASPPSVRPSLVHLRVDADGRGDRPSTVGAPRAGEWRGNLMLMAVISLLVGIATFVLCREKLADTSATTHSSAVRN